MGSVLKKNSEYETPKAKKFDDKLEKLHDCAVCIGKHESRRP
jgi:hypothetical protein